MSRSAINSGRVKRRWRFPAPLWPTAHRWLLFFTIPLALSPLAPAQDQDEETIRINSDLVVLNLTVTNVKGTYIHGLKRTDFRVFEDGVEQKISSFSFEETPFAAAILIDTSGSMEGRETLARSAAIRFLDGLRGDDAAAVYRFDSEIEQVQDFSSTRDLAPIVYNLRAHGMTALNDAIVRAAQDLAQRPEKRRAIIILSDGADTHSRASAEEALNAALGAQATIYAVDMAALDRPSPERQIAAGALRNFANKTGGRYISTPGGQALRDAFASIVEELSNQYTLTYQPSNRARDGRWRTIEVKVSRADATVRTRRGYRVPKS
jgi:Ca-activated chloride channel family protein